MQVQAIAEVTKAIATGDLAKKVTWDAKGDMNFLQQEINSSVDHLNSFAQEVTRVVREVIVRSEQLVVFLILSFAGWHGGQAGWSS